MATLYEKIKTFAEMKQALTDEAKEIARAGFGTLDIKAFLQGGEKASKAYDKMIQGIMQKLIDSGVMKDQLELANEHYGDLAKRTANAAG